MSRAFVIGNGPSLASTDLDQLTGETCYAMNRIHLRYGQPGCERWRPTHFVFVDYQTTLAESLVMEEFALHIRAGEEVFVDATMREPTWKKLKSPDRLPANVHFLELCDRPGHVGGDWRSPDAPGAWHLGEDRPWCKFASGLFVAMQLAAAAGHDPIVLVGCDLGYIGWEEGTGDPNHFDPAYVVPRPGGGPDGRMDAEYAALTNAKLAYAHRVALESCRAMGIAVLNATVGGALEVYPRVDLAEAVIG
jgi:hypothetical protein